MKTIKILAVLIVLLAVTNIAISNSFAGRGEELVALNNEISQLKHQNIRLKLTLSQKASFKTISNTTAYKEFTSPTKVAGVRTTLPVAMR